MLTMKKTQRASVSAEVYGFWNKPREFIPRFIPKTHEQIQRIIDRLSKSFIFAELEEKDKDFGRIWQILSLI